jgi:MoaA/NifB/PqqE/SkfB family radical SAM enzyme
MLAETEVKFQKANKSDLFKIKAVNKTVTQRIEYGLKARLNGLTNSMLFLKTAFSKTKSVAKSLRLLRKLGALQKRVWGKMPKKWISVNGKKYFMLYTPGLPSVHLQRMFDMEINRIEQNRQSNGELRFAFFAITKKCPLQCAHCFEWDKLHSKELLSYCDLRNVVLKLKEMNIVQLHLSGGEPMLRVNDIVKLAEEFNSEMEFYVLTSGFNATRENIIKLKNAGVTGLVVSIDHHDKNMHNTFRGSQNSFDDAVNAVCFAREANMLVTLSVCVTRPLATFNELLNYAHFAKAIDVSFIQLLEPRQVGNFAGKDVLLNAQQIKTLSDFYYELNFNKKYKTFPVVVYHGYYQSKVGCFSAGNRSVYIDTNGDILLCPFCHQKNGNIRDGNMQEIIPMMRDTGCPSYGISKI